MNTVSRRRPIEMQKLVMLVILVGIFIFLSLAAPNFFAIRNFTNILMQVSVIVMIASAANLLMITGNFDLSVGSVFAFSAIMHAFLTKHGMPIWASILACIAMAALWGVFNGVMVGVLKVTPVIATIATMYAARGLAYLVARWDGGANITAGLPQNFAEFGRTMVFGQVPIIIFFMVAVFLVFLFVEGKTLLGRFSYAIGSNRSAALLSGINVVGVIVTLYVIVGALTGLSGVIQVSRVGSAFPNIGQGLEFDVVVAIVLGGTSMMGGEGSIVGMLLGALVVGLAANGLNLFGVQYFYQTITYGVILIGAVLIDQAVRRKA
ncbi:MAG: ABC transporter permease [Lysobacterales bacterium]|nr:MAG: ABC transporter permease [Xanthomonadales bacterium]